MDSAPTEQRVNDHPVTQSQTENKKRYFASLSLSSPKLNQGFVTEKCIVDNKDWAKYIKLESFKRHLIGNWFKEMTFQRISGSQSIFLVTRPHFAMLHFYHTVTPAMVIVQVPAESGYSSALSVLNILKKLMSKETFKLQCKLIQPTWPSETVVCNDGQLPLCRKDLPSALTKEEGFKTFRVLCNTFCSMPNSASSKSAKSRKSSVTAKQVEEKPEFGGKTSTPIHDGLTPLGYKYQVTSSGREEDNSAAQKETEARESKKVLECKTGELLTWQERAHYMLGNSKTGASIGPDDDMSKTENSQKGVRRTEEKLKESNEKITERVHELVKEMEDSKYEMEIKLKSTQDELNKTLVELRRVTVENKRLKKENRNASKPATVASVLTQTPTQVETKQTQTLTYVEGKMSQTSTQYDDDIKSEVRNLKKSIDDKNEVIASLERQLECVGKELHETNVDYGKVLVELDKITKEMKSHTTTEYLAKSTASISTQTSSPPIPNVDEFPTLEQQPDNFIQGSNHEATIPVQESDGGSRVHLNYQPNTPVERQIYNQFHLLVLIIGHLLARDTERFILWTRETFGIRANNEAEVNDIFLLLDNLGMISSSNLTQPRAFFESIQRMDLVHLIDQFQLGDYDILRRFPPTPHDRPPGVHIHQSGNKDFLSLHFLSFRFFSFSFPLFSWSFFFFCL